MSKKQPQAPAFKEPYHSAFFFFWLWQYQLRHEYLDFINGLPQIDWPRVDDYLLSREQDQRYIQTSSQILGAYLNGELELKHLPTMAPLWFRSGYGIAEKYEFKDGQLCMKLDSKGYDTQQLQDPRFRQALKDEINSMIDMIIDDKEGNGRMPESLTALYLPLYWIKANTGGIKNLKVDMRARVTGLWLWDKWILNPEQNYQPIIIELFNKFNRLYEFEVPKDWESWPQESSIENPDDYTAVSKRFIRRTKGTHHSIKEGKVLQL